MTRINVGIPPKGLSGKHLIAEHREIKRIPNLVKKGKLSDVGKPNEFKLGTGHVKFFRDKLGYLLERYNELYDECLRRGYKVTNYEDAWDGVPEELMGGYKPTKEAIKIVKERIEEKTKK